MMKRTVRRAIVILLCIVVLLVGGFFVLGGEIGVPKSCLAEELRASQKIPNDWLVTGTVCDTAALYLFYPPDKSCYGYTVYVNRPGLSFGYIFQGSTTVAVADCPQAALPTEVQQLSIGGSGQNAYFSLNFAQVQNVEVGNGQSTEMYPLDSSVPFTILLPQSSSEITFYDRNGNPVETQTAPL